MVNYPPPYWDFFCPFPQCWRSFAPFPLVHTTPEVAVPGAQPAISLSPFSAALLSIQGPKLCIDAGLRAISVFLRLLGSARSRQRKAQKKNRQNRDSGGVSERYGISAGHLDRCAKCANGSADSGLGVIEGQQIGDILTGLALGKRRQDRLQIGIGLDIASTTGQHQAVNDRAGIHTGDRIRLSRNFRNQQAYLVRTALGANTNVVNCMCHWSGDRQWNTLYVRGAVPWQS